MASLFWTNSSRVSGLWSNGKFGCVRSADILGSASEAEVRGPYPSGYNQSALLDHVSRLSRAPSTGNRVSVAA